MKAILKLVACAIAFVNAQDSSAQPARETRQAPQNVVDVISAVPQVDVQGEYARDKARGYFSKNTRNDLPDGFQAEMKQAVDGAIAQTLNMSLDGLKEAMSDPSISIAALAESAGVDLEDVKEGAMENFLAAAVSNGSLTEEQVGQVVKKFSKTMDKKKKAKKIGKKLSKKMSKKNENQEKKYGRGKDTRGKTDGRGKGDGRTERLAGLKDAVQQAVDDALSTAGIEVPEEPNKADKMAMYVQAKAAGLDLEAIREAAAEAFVVTGVTAGTITNEAAKKFFDKGDRKALREEMEGQIELAVVSALDMSVEEMKALMKSGRDALKQKAEGLGVDLKAIKESATELFLDGAVADGRLTEEETAKIIEKNRGKAGKGIRGDRPEKPAKGDKPEKGRKVENKNGQKKGGQKKNGGNAGRGDRGDRPEKPAKGDKTEKGRKVKGKKGGQKN